MRSAEAIDTVGTDGSGGRLWRCGPAAGLALEDGPELGPAQAPTTAAAIARPTAGASSVKG